MQLLLGEGVADVASILVTGASGMIGLYLTSSLLHKKHRVYGIDNRKNDYIGTDPNYTFVQDRKSTRLNSSHRT